MMKGKLGLITNDSDDGEMVNDLFQLMYKNEADYTNTFIYLMNNSIPQEKLIKDKDFVEWENKWNSRISKNQNSKKAKELMAQNNPIIIPRNHLVESALSKAEEGDLTTFNRLLSILKNPYQDLNKLNKFKQPAPHSEKDYQTFCGT